jgi:hypothetical protein
VNISIDAAILKVLNGDPTASVREITQEAKLSASTIFYEPNIEAQIDLFMRVSGIEPHGVIPVAVDAMTLSYERPCLSAEASDYLFVFYVQSLSLDQINAWRCTCSRVCQGAQRKVCRVVSIIFVKCFLIGW